MQVMRTSYISFISIPLMHNAKQSGAALLRPCLCTLL